MGYCLLQETCGNENRQFGVPMHAWVVASQQPFPRGLCGRKCDHGSFARSAEVFAPAAGASSKGSACDVLASAGKRRVSGAKTITSAMGRWAQGQRDSHSKQGGQRATRRSTGARSKRSRAYTRQKSEESVCSWLSVWSSFEETKDQMEESQCQEVQGQSTHTPKV